MAGGIYKVVYLSSESEGQEGGAEAALFTELELIHEFAPKIDTARPTQLKLVNDWIKSFVGSEAIQAGYGVTVEKVDARQVFEERHLAFQSFEKQARDAKRELVSALRSVLADVTDEEIAAGNVHPINASGTAKGGVVEFYVSKSKVPVKDFLTKYGTEFPSAVQKELGKLQETRSIEVKNRLDGKSTKTAK